MMALFRKSKKRSDGINPELMLSNILSEKISKENRDFFERVAGAMVNDTLLRENFSSARDVDFVDKKILLDNLDSLAGFARSNYDLEPFACDGSGGVYVVLDGKKIGYIDSEGSAGIVANNMRDFFGIVANCGSLSDCATSDCLRSEKDFTDYFNKLRTSRKDNSVKAFVCEYDLDDDPKRIYEVFRGAVTTEPKLLLTATSDDYEDYKQLFRI